jgi:hypothetical protein
MKSRFSLPYIQISCDNKDLVACVAQFLKLGAFQHAFLIYFYLAGDPHATRAVESGDSLPAACNRVFKALEAKLGDSGKVHPCNLTDQSKKL